MWFGGVVIFVECGVDVVGIDVEFGVGVDLLVVVYLDLVYVVVVGCLVVGVGYLYLVV